VIIIKTNNFLIIILSLFIIFFSISITYKNNQNKIQNQIINLAEDPNTEYSIKSKNFNINVYIDIGEEQKKKHDLDYTDIKYTLKIENLTNKIIKNIKVIVFPDNKIKTYIKFGNLNFQTDNDKIYLHAANNYEPYYSYTIYNKILTKDLRKMQIQDQENLYEALEKPIKVIIIWDKEKENLLITEDKIKITTYLEP